MSAKLQIKKVIAAHGFTISEVAERLGISRIALSRHVNGNPSADVLIRIAGAVGCKVGEFFEDECRDEANVTCPHCGKVVRIRINVVTE